MSSALMAGAEAKIDRAYQNIVQLNAVRESFLRDLKPFISVNQSKTRASSASVWSPLVPSSIPVIVGDCIHDLRSALEHAFFELVVMERRHLTAAEEQAVTFPLCMDAKDLPGMLKGKVQGWVPMRSVPIVQRLQPCNNLPAHDYPLRIVHDMNIRDKHRTITVVAINFDLRAFLAAMPDGQAGQREAFYTNLEMNPGANVEIVFPDFASKGPVPVIRALLQLAKSVQMAVRDLKASVSPVPPIHA